MGRLYHVYLQCIAHEQSNFRFYHKRLGQMCNPQPHANLGVCELETLELHKFIEQFSESNRGKVPEVQGLQRHWNLFSTFLSPVLGGNLHLGILISYQFLVWSISLSIRLAFVFSSLFLVTVSRSIEQNSSGAGGTYALLDKAQTTDNTKFI